MNFVKKEIKIILILAAMFILIPVYSLCASKGKVITETVRMRKEATTDSEIITLLSQDNEVEILSEEGNWYKVSYEEYTGYVSAEFIQKDGEVISQENKTIDTQEETNQETSTLHKIQVEEQQKEQPKSQQETININSIKNVTKTSNIYYLPLIHSDIISVVEEAQEAYIIQVVNGWAYVTVGKTSGWIRIDALSQTVTPQEEQENEEQIEEEKPANEQLEVPTEETNAQTDVQEDTRQIGYINAENVNFRKNADKTSDIIDILSLNTEVEILEQNNGWYKIKVNNKEGYVATTLISDTKAPSSRSEDTPRTDNLIQAESDIQTQIVEYAKTFLGYPYVYGGTTPNGFDCSGFVQYVYKHFGYNISRSSVTQAKDGNEVGLENLELGDILIFKAYDDYSRIGHVGIYIGNNQFIHANDEKTGVITTSLSKGKYPERFVCGRRIV